jgi:hypothetical protein
VTGTEKDITIEQCKYGEQLRTDMAKTKPAGRANPGSNGRVRVRDTQAALGHLPSFPDGQANPDSAALLTAPPEMESLTTSWVPDFDDVVFIEVPRAQVLERLGCPSHVEPSSRLRQQINRAITCLWDQAQPRIAHRSYPMSVENGFVRVGSGITLKSARLAQSLASCHTLHVFLATLGRRMDQFIDRTMRRRPDFGVVADAVASVGAEAMVDQFTQDLSDSLPPDQALSLPFSPGYCDWPVDEQRKMFSLLPERPAGTTLSADLMMSPRKSVSGVLGEGSETEVAETRNPCAACARTDCPHRRCPYRRER